MDQQHIINQQHEQAQQIIDGLRQQLIEQHTQADDIMQRMVNTINDLKTKLVASEERSIFLEGHYVALLRATTPHATTPFSFSYASLSTPTLTHIHQHHSHMYHYQHQQHHIHQHVLRLNEN
jgi:hypothetical protein